MFLSAVILYAHCMSPECVVVLLKHVIKGGTLIVKSICKKNKKKNPSNTFDKTWLSV